MSQIYQALKRAVIRQVPDETITWNSVALSDSEATQDYDFISFSGRTENLLSDSIVRSFIDQANGKVFKKPREALCRSSNFKHVLHFCTIGDYMLGVTLFNNIVSEVGVANRANKQFYRDLIQRNNQTMHHLTNIPFRDIEAFLLSHYSNMHLTIFRYGQKTTFAADGLTQLLSGVNPGIHIDIAVAVEVDAPDLFLLPNAYYFSGSEIYSFLGNSQAGPLFVKNPQETFLDSYHICIYNTIQHIRKHTDYHISTSLQNFDLADSLRSSVTRLTNDCIDLFERLDEHKKLRIEVYINFSPRYDLQVLIDQMKQLLLTENVISGAASSEVKNQVKYQCTLTRNLTINCPFESFTDFFIVCSLYTQLISNVFCVEKISSTFRPGFFLPAHMFTNAFQVCFSPEPIVCVPKYFNNHEELQLLIRIKQIESSLTVPMSELKELLHKVSLEIESFYEKFYQKYNSMVGETVTLEKFIQKQKSVTNSVHSAIADAILAFHGRHIFAELTKRIVKHGLSLKVHGRVFMYHACSVSASLAVTEYVDIASFRLQLESFYQARQRNGLRDFVGTLEFPEEFMQRLLLTMVPERLLTSEYDFCPLVPLQNVFTSTNGFLRFSIFLFIYVKLGDMNQVPKVLGNFRESVRNHVLRRQYTAAQLMLYTGCFVPEGYFKNTVAIQKVPPKRISRLILFPSNKFLKLLKQKSAEDSLIVDEGLDHDAIMRMIEEHETEQAFNSSEQMSDHRQNEQQATSFEASARRGSPQTAELPSTSNMIDFHQDFEFREDDSELFQESQVLHSEFDSFKYTSQKEVDSDTSYTVLFTSELLIKYKQRFASLSLTVKDIQDASEEEIRTMCAEASGLSVLLCKSIARELKFSASQLQ